MTVAAATPTLWTLVIAEVIPQLNYGMLLSVVHKLIVHLGLR